MGVAAVLAIIYIIAFFFSLLSITIFCVGGFKSLTETSLWPILFKGNKVRGNLFVSSLF